MNKESRLFEGGRKLPVVEEFYSIQGEGFHVGKPAYFLRVGGCDVGCHWCDTKFSWNSDLHPVIEVEMILKNIDRYAARSVVITGGEPLLFNLNYICNKLKNKGIEVLLETSGSHNLTGEWDWICLSPKKKQPPVGNIYSKASELKMIIASGEDFQWAEYNAKKVKRACELYLQPEWSVYNNIIEELTEYVKENPHWKVSLQAHKFMKIP